MSLPIQYARITPSTEDTHTNTTDAANFDKTLTVRADTHKVGDLHIIDARVATPTTNSTDTLTLLLTWGGITIATLAALDVADTTVVHLHAEVEILVVGAANTAKIGVVGWSMVTGSNAAVTATIGEFTGAGFSTNADTTIAVNADWSAASASDIARLDSLRRIKIPVHPGNPS